jgi:hypothetical protein
LELRVSFVYSCMRLILASIQRAAEALADAVTTFLLHANIKFNDVRLLHRAVAVVNFDRFIRDTRLITLGKLCDDN